MVQELVSPAAWNKKLSSLTGDAATKAFSVLVCGPKSSGKSTFSKILVNRLVTGRAASRGVAVLDLDPGQPEYAPPGTLSLVHVTEPNLTPAFTHIPSHSSFYRLKRCHSLASVSPASDMECCLSIALSLYAEYRKTLFQENVPLVVNTPGWVLGAGLELLDEVISAMTPNEVIYMSEEGPAETVDALEASVKGTSGTTLSTLPSQPAEFTARTGAHLRAMHTMSYFHSTSSGWDTTPVAAMAPWAVSYSGIKRDIRGVLFYDFQPMPSMVARAINGMVLALVEIEDARAYRNIDLGTSTSTTGTTSPEGIPLLRSPTGTTLDPAYSRTVGLVLVREIDKARKQLHLSTPIPVEEVRGISKRGRDLVLVHGNFDVPSWSYTEDLHQRADDVASGTKTLDVEEQNENTSDDDSDMEPQNAKEASDVAAVSWVEVRKGNEKRPVGSKKWRVRRDLGRYD